jgi:hypothetical protein
MGTLTEWLKIMLGEVERKQDETARDEAEQQRRVAESAAAPLPPGKARK